jgi:hypothetical protein
MNLENINISYLIISSDRIDIISNLYTMNYNLVEMKSYGDYHDALVAYSDGLDNDTLRVHFPY